MYVFIPIATCGQEDNQRKKLDLVLLAGSLHICCFPVALTAAAGLCLVYYEPCKIFPSTESVIYISFQILHLLFSEVCSCLGEGV